MILKMQRVQNLFLLPITERKKIMAILQCFFLPVELEKYIKELVSAKGLVGYCRYAGKHYELLKNLQINPIFRDESVLKLFLLPNTQELPDPTTVDEIRSRDMGWLDINPGQLYIKDDDSILTMTTLQAEDKKSLPFRPSDWIKWLKRNFSSSITFGVEAVNIKLGEKDVFKNIGYSSEALRLYEEGTLWKQYVKGNVVFNPFKP